MSYLLRCAAYLSHYLICLIPEWLMWHSIKPKQKTILISLQFGNFQVKTNHESNLKVQNCYKKTLTKWNRGKKEKGSDRTKALQKGTCQLCNGRGLCFGKWTQAARHWLLAVISPCGYPHPWGKNKWKQLCWSFLPYRGSHVYHPEFATGRGYPKKQWLQLRKCCEQGLACF